MKWMIKESRSLLKNRARHTAHLDGKRHVAKQAALSLLIMFWAVGFGSLVALGQEPEEEQAQAAAENLSKVAEEANVKLPGEISKDSLVELVAKAKELKDRGKLDLDNSIEVTIDADRDSDGKLANVVIIQKKNDPKVLELAQDSVNLISASGVLSFLEGVERLRLNVRLSKSSFDLSASAEVESAERAAQMAKGYSLMLAAGSFIKRGLEEESLYKSTKVSSKGQKLNLNFSMSSATLGEMLLKLLPAAENPLPIAENPM